MHGLMANRETFFQFIREVYKKNEEVKEIMDNHIRCPRSPEDINRFEREFDSLENEI